MTTETMTDLITAEEAKKLLDHYGLPTDCDCNDEDCVKCSHYPTLQERASKKLKEISPNLARTVIALHAQLADAQAAQAMVVEREAKEADRAAHIYGQRQAGSNGKEARDWQSMKLAALDIAQAIRALAPIDGLAILAELRAERDTLRALCEDRFNEIARLAAANAVLEAKVAGLVVALRKHHEWHLSQDRDGNAWGIDPVDAYSESGLCEETCAALATLRTESADTPDADTAAIRHHERFGPLDEHGNPVDPRRRG